MRFLGDLLFLFLPCLTLHWQWRGQLTGSDEQYCCFFVFGIMKDLSKHYYLGVDLGSTTAKYVLMDSDAQILRKSYVRHQSAVV